ncbi:MAG: hypothetical protein R3E39_12015 [Anaerolineae bacterium]
MTQSNTRESNFPRTPDWRALLAIIAGTVLYYLPLSRMGFLGHDWLAYFAVQATPSIAQHPNPSYPPWVLSVTLRPLMELSPFVGLAILNALTISCIVVLTFRYARFAWPNAPVVAYMGVLFALFSPLPWMMMWLGQVDTTVLLGLVMLPFGVPLVLGKLHTGLWAVLGSRRDILWAAAWGLISLVIWGFWPLSILTQVAQQHPIIMGWRSTSPIFLFVGIGLLCVTNRDPLRLMAAGTFISPYMMPYHYLVLLPIFGRVNGWKQVVLWLGSLTFILETGLSTPATKVLALSFPLLVWLLSTPSLRPRELLNDPDTILNRSLTTLNDVRQRLSSRQPVLGKG